MKTFEQYLTRIRQAYEVAQQGAYASYLVSPTPALVKQLCLLLYQSEGLSSADRMILKHFFGWISEQEALKKMEHFDADRLKPVCRFLTGQTQTPHVKLVDLLALITDTHPRPYAKYMQSAGSDTPQKITGVKTTQEDSSSPTNTPPSKNSWKTYALGGLVLAGLATTGVLTQGPRCEKMVWNGTSFDKIDCNEEVHYVNRSVEFYDATRHQSFKKVIPCDTTTFFKHEQPKLWYYKTKEGNIECFSAPGLHPENGATLKKITPYIIKKYGLKKDCLSGE
jgi:hypothetical protein